MHICLDPSDQQTTDTTNRYIVYNWNRIAIAVAADGLSPMW